jgi:dethiobiotin synthetase
MRLGCLNHALLTAESIARQTRLVGWVANCLPPQQNRLQENIETLVARMPAPLLGVFPGDGEGAQDLQLKRLISGR